MHKIADKVQAAVNIPVIQIAEETAKAVAAKQLKTVALLGPKHTMQLDFYKKRIANHDTAVIFPDNEDDIEYIKNAIYNEMGKGIFLH